jgi:predicted HicB family RNase H-like nuclease
LPAAQKALMCSHIRIEMIWIASRMPTNKTTLSVRVDDDIRAELKRFAKVDERSTSSYIARALKAHVEERKQREGKARKP